MRAIVSSTTAANYNVEVAEIPTPEPAAGQVQVRVAAATVNPVDRAVADPNLLRSIGFQLPDRVGLGWDLAGTVSAIGAGVQEYHVGDPVIGLVDKFVTPVGAQSEFVVLDTNAVAALPVDADLEEAATLPLNASTALQAIRLSGARSGDTMLVTGAAGAVGHFAVEYGALAGLQVIGLGRARDEAAVLGAGAKGFVASGPDVAARIAAAVPRGFDVIIDAAQLVDVVTGVITPGGSFIALTDGSVPTIDGAKVTKVNVRADAEDLKRVVADWRAQRISTAVAGRYRFDQVSQAQQRLAAGGVRGRLVLLPSDHLLRPRIPDDIGPNRGQHLGWNAG